MKPLDQPGWHTLDGTIRVLCAEALFPLTAILTAAYLTRQLGPDGYGILTLTVSLVVWIEMSISSLFARTTIKFVRQAADWIPVGRTVLRLHLFVSLFAATALMALAGPIASLLEEPELASYLRLLAIDIPIFSLADAHRNILVGLGQFRKRAYVGAYRWLARLVFIVVLVELGLSISGALLGMIAASVVELALYRYFVRPPLAGPSTFRARDMAGYAIPLFLTAVSLCTFDKLDLFMLKALGGTAEQAGIYVAAQNLALLPTLFAMALAPLLLSSLSYLLGRGEAQAAASLARNAQRGVLMLLPLAALVAAAAGDIVNLIYGSQYAGSAKLLAVLIFGGTALVIISITTAALTAAGKPRWCLAIAAPMVLCVAAGHAVVIPLWGASGAAATTTAVAFAGAVFSLVLMYRYCGVTPPLKTLLRCTLVSAAMFTLVSLWPVHGVWILLQLPFLTAMIIVVLFLLGEFSREELALFRSVIFPAN